MLVTYYWKGNYKQVTLQVCLFYSLADSFPSHDKLACYPQGFFFYPHKVKYQKARAGLWKCSVCFHPEMASLTNTLWLQHLAVISIYDKKNQAPEMGCVLCACCVTHVSYWVTLLLTCEQWGLFIGAFEQNSGAHSVILLINLPRMKMQL